MNKYFLKKITLTGSLFFYLSVFSQLTTSPPEFWEKTNPGTKEAVKCRDESLLNFHCGIQDKLLKKYIRYSKNKSHTLSVVHASKEDEMIWTNPDKNILLSNTQYNRDKKISELGKRPSIFTYLGLADSRYEKSDSLKIKLQDKNLYELIFYPRKATTMDLNKIHSYLSIKYGISLEKGKYYASNGNEIWDPGKHTAYKYRPTGLGRDDGNQLYQKQSSNQADPFLSIGFNTITRTNSENSTILDNHNFVMWSDNNKSMSFRHEKEMDILERSWEIDFIGKTVPKTNYSIRIKKETVNPKSLPQSYWMLLTKDNGEIKKVSGTESEQYVIFNKVDFMDAFDSGDKTHFTFAVSPLSGSKPENPNHNPKQEAQYALENISIDYDKISLYPNPVKKDQNFTIVFPPMEDLAISIYDGGGRLVKLDKISHTAKSYVNHLPVQSSYLISLTRNGKIIKTFKLIVD